MATKKGTERVLEAAQILKTECLIKGKSVFFERQLWTKKNLQELKELFIEHPDESKHQIFKESIRLFGRVVSRVIFDPR